MLEVRDLRKAFGGVEVLCGTSLSVPSGSIACLIGPNGAGKSTVLDVITGICRQDSGSVTFRGNDLSRLSIERTAHAGLGRTFQRVRLFGRLSVEANLLLCAAYQTEKRRILATRGWFWPLARHSATSMQARDLADRFGLGDRWETPAASLSFGQKKLLSLICCAITGASLLLLDEPFAGLPSTMIERVEEFLKALVHQEGRSLLIVEHNRNTVVRLADRVVILVAGRTIAEGSVLDLEESGALSTAFAL